jgi:cytochrome c-type biogenesis protein CcmH
MTPENRMAMIRSMVDGLDEKLKTNPDDVEGWLRLIRARTVLKEDNEAAAALATARATFATNPANVKVLNDLAIELKLK